MRGALHNEQNWCEISLSIRLPSDLSNNGGFGGNGKLLFLSCIFIFSRHNNEERGIDCESKTWEIYPNLETIPGHGASPRGG